MNGQVSVGRRERKKLELELRIRRAAAQLFHARGYEATTVDEIAERADVAKATLFNYFPRKDALLLAVWEDTHREVLESLGPPSSWRGTGPEQLRLLFNALAAATERNPQLTRVMLIEAMRSFWLSTEPTSLEAEFRQLLERLVAAAQARGELAADTDPRVGADLLREVYGTTVVHWLRKGEEGRTLKTELDAKLDVILRGLGARNAPRKG
jgi:TetR/AcrR family transcriptional regulator, cholesterol catabolism regulator